MDILRTSTVSFVPPHSITVKSLPAQKEKRYKTRSIFVIERPLLESRIWNVEFYFFSYVFVWFFPSLLWVGNDKVERANVLTRKWNAPCSFTLNFFLYLLRLLLLKKMILTMVFRLYQPGNQTVEETHNGDRLKFAIEPCWRVRLDMFYRLQLSFWQRIRLLFSFDRYSRSVT